MVHCWSLSKLLTSSNLYLMAGNIGRNYIVRFHEKITVFLLAELNIAF